MGIQHIQAIKKSKKAILHSIVDINSNAVTGISLKEIISEIWMFIGVLIFALIIMILFPELILWLPEMFGYKS